MSDARRASNAGSRPIDTVSRLGIVVLCLVLSGSLGWAQSAPPAIPQVSDWDVFAKQGLRRMSPDTRIRHRNRRS